MRIWFEIISELFINLAAAWYVLVFIEPQIASVKGIEDIWRLTLRFVAGTMFLVAAWVLRKEVKK